MNNRETFRPRANILLAGFGALVCALYTWSSFYNSTVNSKIAHVLGALGVTIFLYMILVRPKIIFADEGIVITNPLREYTIGWADVIAFDTKWAFTVETKTFTVYAWAATASSRKRRSIHESEVLGMDINVGGSIRTADSPFTDSGAAAFRAKARLKRFSERPQSNAIATSIKLQIQPLMTALSLLLAAIVVNILRH